MAFPGPHLAVLGALMVAVSIETEMGFKPLRLAVHVADGHLIALFPPRTREFLSCIHTAQGQRVGSQIMRK
jgi:hypothetical protein